MNLKCKLNLLEKLKEERDSLEQKPRWGVKERWTGNGDSFFKDLRESLTTSNTNRIENLKRSMSI